MLHHACPELDWDEGWASKFEWQWQYESPIRIDKSLAYYTTYISVVKYHFQTDSKEKPNTDLVLTIRKNVSFQEYGKKIV